MLDKINTDILTQKQTRYLNHPTNHPSVGDFVKLSNNEYHRISYARDNHIQLSKIGSWYLHGPGMEYSGGHLYETFQFNDFQLTNELKTGEVWFFSHGEVKENGRINANLQCKVWNQTNIIKGA